MSINWLRMDSQDIQTFAHGSSAESHTLSLSLSLSLSLYIYIYINTCIPVYTCIFERNCDSANVVFEFMLSMGQEVGLSLWHHLLRFWGGFFGHCGLCFVLFVCCGSFQYILGSNHVLFTGILCGL